MGSSASNASTRCGSAGATLAFAAQSLRATYAPLPAGSTMPTSGLPSLSMAVTRRTPPFARTPNFVEVAEVESWSFESAWIDTPACVGSTQARRPQAKLWSPPASFLSPPAYGCLVAACRTAPADRVHQPTGHCGVPSGRRVAAPPAHRRVYVSSRVGPAPTHGRHRPAGRVLEAPRRLQSA